MLAPAVLTVVVEQVEPESTAPAGQLYAGMALALVVWLQVEPDSV